MSTLVSDSVKCKQKEVNTYTLNSLACIGSVVSCQVMLSCWCKVSQVSISATLTSYGTMNQSVYGWIHVYIYNIYIYIYIYTHISELVEDNIIFKWAKTHLFAHN